METKLTKQDVKVINNAKGLAKFLSVDITIKIFGVTIWEYHFPPLERRDYND